MSVIIHKLHGMNPELEDKLRAKGIKDSDDLLMICRSYNNVIDLARALSIDPQAILELAHRADLARIRGIGEAYTGLLEAAGVRSINDLATSCPESLRTQFTRINVERRLVGRVPAQAMVNGWVNKARRLPRVLQAN